MPGRPRTMARKVAELEEVVSQAAARLDQRMPAMYRDESHALDELATMWREAVNDLWSAASALMDLLGVLEAKIPAARPAPAALVLAEDGDDGQDTAGGDPVSISTDTAAADDEAINGDA